MASYRELIIKISADISGMDSKLRRAEGHVKQFTGRFQSFGLALGGVSLGLAGLGIQAVKTAGDYEQIETALKMSMGSLESAKKHLEDIRNFALKTPFEFNELAVLSQKVQMVGTAARDVIPVLTAFGNAASANRIGSEGLNRIVYAFGQMKQAGKVAATEMRQMTEALIPAWDILAKMLKTDVAGAMEAVHKKQVQSAQFMPFLIKELNVRFAGAMEEQSKTILGRWTNVRDLLTKLFTQIGQDIEPVAKTILTFIEDAAKGFTSMEPSVRKWVEAFGGFTIVGGTAVFVAGIFFDKILSIVLLFKEIRRLSAPILKALAAVVAFGGKVGAAGLGALVAGGPFTLAGIVIARLGLAIYETKKGLDRLEESADRAFDPAKWGGKWLHPDDKTSGPAILGNAVRILNGELVANAAAVKAVQSMGVIHGAVDAAGNLKSFKLAEARKEYSHDSSSMFDRLMDSLQESLGGGKKKKKPPSHKSLYGHDHKPSRHWLNELQSTAEKIVKDRNAAAKKLDDLYKGYETDMVGVFVTPTELGLKRLTNSLSRSLPILKKSGEQIRKEIGDIILPLSIAPYGLPAGPMADNLDVMGFMKSYRGAINPKSKKPKPVEEVIGLHTSTLIQKSIKEAEEGEQRYQKTIRHLERHNHRLAQSFVDVLFKVNSLSEAMKSLGISYLKSLATMAIETQFNRMNTLIASTLTSAGGSGFGNIVGKILGFGGAGGGAAGKGKDVASSVSSAVPGAVRKVSDSAAKASAIASTAASSASQSIGAITGAISAVADVIQVFQMRRLNKNMGRVEESTRFASIDINTLVNIMNKYLPNLQWIHERLIHIVEHGIYIKGFAEANTPFVPVLGPVGRSGAAANTMGTVINVNLPDNARVFSDEATFRRMLETAIREALSAMSSGRGRGQR